MLTGSGRWLQPHDQINLNPLVFQQAARMAAQAWRHVPESGKKRWKSFFWKLAAGHGETRRPLKQQGFCSKRSISDLAAATKGSAGLDLATSADTELDCSSVKAIATNVWGPLPNGFMGLLSGCSSTTLQGVKVHPGVIDSDYTGEIKILASALNGSCKIPEGQKLAQLVLIPYWVPKVEINTRNTSGFGSSGKAEVYWTQEITQMQPLLNLNRVLSGLIGTGADVSIISVSVAN
uniref:dUTPase-like domain-containing protein n=1 Tax=Amazona collaria TaxID=241587 RepID=A0A8B9IY31_9PSIT